jgi:MFS family permease
MEGPLAVAAIIVGLVASLVMWGYAPDNRHLGRALKVVAIGVFIFSIGTLLAQL